MPGIPFSRSPAVQDAYSEKNNQHEDCSNSKCAEAEIRVTG